MVDLHEFFAYKPENYYVLIWHLPDKKSEWFKDIDKAETFVENINDGYDVYMGGGLASPDFVENLKNASKRRCPQAEISGLIGLWADIDVQAEHRSKPNLPQSKDEAMQLINDIPLKPSVIIDSGYGFQCWWLFNEPYIFDTQQEKQNLKELLKDWNYTIKVIADKKNWAVDATHDLSRVMRVPGTFNNKQEEPKEVKITEITNKRYSPSAFIDYLADNEEHDITITSAEDGINPEVGDLKLDPKAQPPFDKWNALQSVEPKAQASFNHNRDDDLNDASASGYDMALASYAALADWQDQEIVDLLIAHRRNNSCDLKLRQDYYKRTIKKAKSYVAKLKSEEALGEVVKTAEEVHENEDLDEEKEEEIRSEIISHISNMFGIQIQRFIKYTSDPPQYRIETSKGNTILGGSSALLRPRTFRSKIIDATNVVIPKFKSEKWENIVQALLNCCIEESLGEGATNSGIAHEWLCKYFKERAILDSPQEASMNDYPFEQDSKYYIFGGDFRKWLKINEMEKLSAKKMGTILRAYGSEPTRIKIQEDGNRTTRSVWEIPKEKVDS